MITHTPGVRPRLLAFLVAIVALAAFLPWLRSGQWAGEAVLAVRAVRDGRPFSLPDRPGHVVLGMVADALLPSSTSLDLNILGFAAGVAAVLATARLRSVLARGGAPVDRLIEPLASALALVAAGPFLARVVTADRAGMEAFLAASAAALAWTGRFPAGMAVFGLLLFVSGRALLSLPVLLAAPRPRGDLVPGLAGLGPWIVYAALFQAAGGRGGAAALVRADLAGSGGPQELGAPAVEALLLAAGLGGVLVMAVVGAAVGILRGGAHRRFAGGVLLAVLFHGAILAPGAGAVEASVALAPWLAVLAGSGVGSVRRAATRIRDSRLATAGAAMGFLVLGSNLAFAVRTVVGPIWHEAARFDHLCRALLKDPGLPTRIVGSWDGLRLAELAADFRSIPWEALPRPLLPPGRPLQPGERALIDEGVQRHGLLLLDHRGFAVPLAQDPRGKAQIFAEGIAIPEATAALPEGGAIKAPWLAEFGPLVLERTEVRSPPGPGGLLLLRLYWRAEWAPGELPSGPRPGSRPTALKASTNVVDSRGAIRLAFPHWLAFGLFGLRELGGRHFTETLMFPLPADFSPGDYGLEIAVFEPLPADRVAHPVDLDWLRERRYRVRVGGIPLGVTPHSVRAASLRLRNASPLR